MAEILSSKKDCSEWNALVQREPGFAMMQSWEWGEIKECLGWKAYRLAVRDTGRMIAGAQMLVKSLPLGKFSVAYVPRGPVGRWYDPDVYQELFQAMHQVAAREHAILLKVEPPPEENTGGVSLLCENGFEYTSFTNQPRATIILDLTPDLDTIFSNFRKSTRRKVRTGPKKGLTTRVGNEVDLLNFYELLEATGERAGFSVHPYQYYQKEYLAMAQSGHTLMMFAYYDNEPVAVNLSYYFGEHAAFFHQASSDKARNLNPNYLLVWESIQWLKEHGCTTYDLWGIPDEIGDILSEEEELPGYERTDGLWGVYKFKAGFGKNIVVFPGAYDYVYKPLPYSLISPIISREETLQPLLKWASLNRLQNDIPGLSYALRELRFVRSFGDLATLVREEIYNIRKSAKRLNAKRQYPLSMQIEPTNCCNAVCEICPGQRSIREKGYMELELFKHILEDAASQGVRRIYLDLHGEPTLHPQIAEMIRFIKNKGLSVRMSTNGMRLNKDLGEVLLHTGMTRADHITFSILGDACYTHNRLMNYADLEVIEDNISTFLVTRGQQRRTGPVIETIFRRVSENRYEEVGYRDTWEGIVDHATLGGPVSESFSNYKMGVPDSVRDQSCQTVQERMTVFWDGTVTICRHDLDGDFIIGDLKEQSIQEIWNDDQLSTLRKLHREERFTEHPLCAHCDF